MLPVRHVKEGLIGGSVAIISQLAYSINPPSAVLLTIMFMNILYYY